VEKTLNRMTEVIPTNPADNPGNVKTKSRKAWIWQGGSQINFK